MIVRDIMVDMRDVLGRYEDAKIYRILNQAIQLMSHLGEGKWESMIGYIDISVDPSSKTITLPRDILTPIQVNFDNNPTFPRTRWYEFHLNGVGGGSAKEYEKAWDDNGFFATFRDLSEPSKLTATTTTVNDDNKKITIAGRNKDDREFEETLLLNFSTPPNTTEEFKTVERILKSETSGTVSLKENNNNQQIGFYYSDDLEPKYRRIRVSAKESVTMMYKRRALKVSNLEDYIPTDNHLAIIQAVRSVNFRYINEPERALVAQNDALQLLELEEDALNIDTPIPPQVMDFSTDANESLYN